MCISVDVSKEYQPVESAVQKVIAIMMIVVNTYYLSECFNDF